jgi:predicted ATPase
VKNLLSTSRLVTLTGTGGVGKTRLALRAASAARGDFADGVWLVELAEVSDPSLVINVVAATLGVRDESATPLIEVLARFSSTREMLLVLDNCEQVVDAVAMLASTLLHSCPELRILVTSREGLDIAGEAILRVVPLAVPDSGFESNLRAMSRFDAVALFADRAAAALPGFELDEDNTADVAQICARLDGLPLAIELAAARLRSMSTDQILQRLNDRFTLLTRGMRTAPTRQQTLRWSIDWSYELCTPAEQRVWARLSVFAGSFELDAAEQICGADSAPENVLDVLSALVDKSILVREGAGTVVRFRMLEILRAYGRQKLQESEEFREVRRRHRDWYERLALDAESEWISDRQPDLIARLDRENPNIREALESCLSEDTEQATETALRMSAALGEFWFFRGLYGEGRSWLDRALAHRDTPSIADRVEALRAYTMLAALQGDFEAVAGPLAEARALADRSPNPSVQAQIAYIDGTSALVRRDLPRASSSLERAVETLGSRPTSVLHVNALSYLAWTYELRSDTARASKCYRELLAITETCGEVFYRCAARPGCHRMATRRPKPCTTTDRECAAPQSPIAQPRCCRFQSRSAGMDCRGRRQRHTCNRSDGCRTRSLDGGKHRTQFPRQHLPFPRGM